MYRVLYDHDPTKPKDTGTDDEHQAIAWAYQHLDDFKQTAMVTFREFAKDFYTEACGWTKLHREHGAKHKPRYYTQKRTFLVNHLLDKLGPYRLDAVTPEQIDKAIVESEKWSGGPVGTATMEKLRVIARDIFGFAVYKGILTANPAEAIQPYRGGGGHEAFTPEQLTKLFPDEVDDALTIWGSWSWYGYFLFLRDTGARPGEVAAFTLADWDREFHGAVLDKAVDQETRKVGPIKTAQKGLTCHPVVFSDRLECVLTQLQFVENVPMDAPAFQVNGKSIEHNAANKHLRASAKRAGVDIGSRSQYSFRHTYYTELLKRLPEKDVTLMAGHKSLRKEYDQRVAKDFLKTAQPIREVVRQWHHETQ